MVEASRAGDPVRTSENLHVSQVGVSDLVFSRVEDDLTERTAERILRRSALVSETGDWRIVLPASLAELPHLGDVVVAVRVTHEVLLVTILGEAEHAHIRKAGDMRRVGTVNFVIIGVVQSDTAFVRRRQDGAGLDGFFVDLPGQHHREGEFSSVDAIIVVTLVIGTTLSWIVVVKLLNVHLIVRVKSGLVIDFIFHLEWPVATVIGVILDHLGVLNHMLVKAVKVIGQRRLAVVKVAAESTRQPALQSFGAVLPVDVTVSASSTENAALRAEREPGPMRRSRLAGRR